MSLNTSDTLSRPLRDLRISVTDRCNFRCVYCMPKHLYGAKHEFLPKEQLLRYEEIAELAAIFVDLGVKKLRLTGGEPLIRREIEKLIKMLAGIDGIEDLSLTTNASRLTRDKAQVFKDAGLMRVTVSLDALDDATFMAINDVEFPVARVLEGIENAEAAGLPVKVNMVVKAGTNDHSIVPMAKFFHGTGHILRFIEYMDVGHTNGWRMDDVLPASEIVERINAELPIQPADPNYTSEVAKRWRYIDGGGEIGIISSVTEPFCNSCSRARLSAKGELYTCLFATAGHDLRGRLRDPDFSDKQLREWIQRIWIGRGDRYSEIRGAETVTMPKVEMSYIGG